MKDVQIQLDKDNPSEILVQIKPDTFRLDNVIIRKKQIIEVKPEDIPNDIMITIIEHSPDFPGGLSGLREYLNVHLQSAVTHKYTYSAVGTAERDVYKRQPSDFYILAVPETVP